MGAVIQRESKSTITPMKMKIEEQKKTEGGWRRIYNLADNYYYDLFKKREKKWNGIEGAEDRTYEWHARKWNEHIRLIMQFGQVDIE